jgi:hypothetical protein
MVTVMEQAMGLSVDEKFQLISALWEGKAKNSQKRRIDQMQLEAVDQTDCGECVPSQPGEDRKTLDEMIRRSKSQE